MKPDMMNTIATLIASDTAGTMKKIFAIPATTATTRPTSRKPPRKEKSFLVVSA